MGLVRSDAAVFKMPDVSSASSVRGQPDVAQKHQKLVAPGRKRSDSSRISELAPRLVSVKANNRIKLPLICLCSGVNDAADAEVAVGWGGSWDGQIAGLPPWPRRMDGSQGWPASLLP